MLTGIHTAAASNTTYIIVTSRDAQATTRTVLGALDPMPTARDRSIDCPGVGDPMDNGNTSALELALFLVVHLPPQPPPPQDVVPAGNLGVTTKACVYFI